MLGFKLTGCIKYNYNSYDYCKITLDIFLTLSFKYNRPYVVSN